MRALTTAVILFTVAGAAQAAPDAPEMRRAKAHFKLGKELYDRGDYKGAIIEYQAAFQLAPLPELVFNIAKAQQRSGDIDGALASFRRYIELDPTGRGSLESRKAVEALSAQIEKRRLAAEKAVAEKAAAEKALDDAQRAEAERQANARLLASARPKKPLTRRPWFIAVVSVGAAVVVAGVATGIAIGATPHDPTPSYGAIRW